MARNRDPFTQALSSLRGRIHSGLLAGGAPVIVRDEAARLRLSTTPIREALARLSGEGLVERAASGGYVTVRLDAATVRDRYAMQGAHVRFAIELNALGLGASRAPAPPFGTGDAAGDVQRLFSSTVCASGNQVLWNAYDRIGGQLSLLRQLEERLFLDLADEAADLFAAYADPRPARYIDAAAGYFDRRTAAAGALAALARDDAP